MVVLNPIMRRAQELLGMSKNPTAVLKYAASLQLRSNTKVISPQESLSKEEEVLIKKKFDEVAELVSGI